MRKYGNDFCRIQIRRSTTRLTRLVFTVDYFDGPGRHQPLLFVALQLTARQNPDISLTDKYTANDIRVVVLRKLNVGKELVWRKTGLREFVLSNQPAIETGGIGGCHPSVTHILQRIDALVVSSCNKHSRYAARGILYIRAFANHDVLCTKLLSSNSKGSGTADQKVQRQRLRPSKRIHIRKLDRLKAILRKLPFQVLNRRGICIDVELRRKGIHQTDAHNRPLVCSIA